MLVRIATSRDSDAVRAVHLKAFPEDEAPTVAKLAVDLLEERSSSDILSLVAESDDLIVGHIAFSPVFIAGNDDFNGYILAPLAVTSGLQQSGVGRTLVDHGMRRLAALGADVVFVYGDPDYYGRYGFSAEAAAGYNAPYRLQYPFGWQAVVLNETNPADPPVTITCVESLSDPGLW